MIVSTLCQKCYAEETEGGVSSHIYPVTISCIAQITGVVVSHTVYSVIEAYYKECVSTCGVI